MKRIAFGILFVSIFSNAAELSDTYESKRPRLGIQAGATFSDVSSPADINSENRSGLAVGVRMEVPLTPYFAVQPEALFVQRGVTLVSAGNTRLTSKFNTIEVPILLKAKLPSQISPYLTAGPVAFFNISQSTELTSPIGGGSASFEPRTFELGVSLGAGVDVGPVFLAANYLIGLTDLDDAGAGGSYQSRGVQVLGGVQF
jgi:opacity protein-like surface antigen